MYQHVIINAPYDYDVLQFNIAGTNYRTGLERCVGKSDGLLEAELDNEYDPNAIKVVHANGTHLGYVPAHMTDDVRKFVDGKLPCMCSGILFKEQDEYDSHPYYWGEAAALRKSKRIFEKKNDYEKTISATHNSRRAGSVQRQPSGL